MSPCNIPNPTHPAQREIEHYVFEITAIFAPRTTSKYSALSAERRINEVVAVGFVPTEIEHTESEMIRTNAVSAFNAALFADVPLIDTVCSAMGGRRITGRKKPLRSGPVARNSEM